MAWAGTLLPYSYEDDFVCSGYCCSSLYPSPLPLPPFFLASYPNKRSYHWLAKLLPLMIEDDDHAAPNPHLRVVVAVLVLPHPDTDASAVSAAFAMGTSTAASAGLLKGLRFFSFISSSSSTSVRWLGSRHGQIIIIKSSISNCIPLL